MLWNLQTIYQYLDNHIMHSIIHNDQYLVWNSNTSTSRWRAEIIANARNFPKRRQPLLCCWTCGCLEIESNLQTQSLLLLLSSPLLSTLFCSTTSATNTGFAQVIIITCTTGPGGHYYYCYNMTTRSLRTMIVNWENIALKNKSYIQSFFCCIY